MRLGVSAGREVPMRERLPAWARARVGARVAAVRAYLTRAVGGAPSARAPVLLGACGSMQRAWQAAAGAASTLRGRLRAEAAAGRLLPEVRLSAMARRRDRRLERRQCTAGWRRSKRWSCANSHLATRAREGFCVRGRARVGSLKVPAKRPSPLAASRARTVGGPPPICYSYSKETPVEPRSLTTVMTHCPPKPYTPQSKAPKSAIVRGRPRLHTYPRTPPSTRPRAAFP